MSGTAFDAIDAIFERFHATGVAPGLAFGVVVDGELAHRGALGTIRAGHDASDAERPGPDTRYRIASMTKSFTAAAVLRLRDDGVLTLDDDVARWVPELSADARWSRDSPPMTIRSLLTMSAGLPTDDPWGDRQLGLGADEFLAFLAAGPSLAWPAGTHFEYANLGYAILGLVVARAAGEPYRAFLERRILEPLGMAATSFDVEDVDPATVAPGYVRRGDEWVEEPTAADGAFAPMGGLFSTVRDLATWVRTFSAAAPPRDDADDQVPLARASLREMQQLHRAISPELRWPSPSAAPESFVSGYGFGLFVVLDTRRGRIVAHGGGLPGHGSNMRWHPATGLGVVAVANGRYAPIGGACRDALELLVDRSVRPAGRPAPWTATTDARAAVERLIDKWDDELARGLFAMNVDLDEDLPSRRSAIERLREVHGRLGPADGEPAMSESPAHLRWWLAGERGRVEVEILLTPERPPRVQWLDITSVPEPSQALDAIAVRVAELLGRPAPAWPDDQPLDPAIDPAALDRDLRAAEAVFGPVTLGPATAGDGRQAASWRLRGPRGDLTLTVELADDGSTVRVLQLVPSVEGAPVHLA